MKELKEHEIKIGKMILSVGIIVSMLACQKEADVPTPTAVSLSGKVKSMEFFVGTGLMQTYAIGYNAKGWVSSLTSTNIEGTKTYIVKADSIGKVSYMVPKGIVDTIYYKYNNLGQLTATKSSKAERFDYITDGRLSYYVRSVPTTSATIYEDIYVNKWEGNKLINQVQSTPGKNYEEENTIFGTEENPLYKLLNTIGNSIILKSPYALSSIMPTKSAKLYEGANLQYSYTLNAKKKLEAFIIKKETLNGLIDYQKWTVSYYP